MSRPFGNWFGISSSQLRMFDRCERQWWHSRVQFWNGWRDTAKPYQRLAYGLTKMTSTPALAGSIAHGLAADLAKSDPDRDLEQALTHGEFSYRRAVSQSVRGLWRDKPKAFTNLFEHYYVTRYADHRIRGGLERLRMATRNLYRAPILGEILAADKLTVEVTDDSWEIDGAIVWVALDVDFEAGDGASVIVDYKTGRESESDRRQAMLYAGYKRAVHGIPLKDIRVVLAYLGEETGPREVHLSPGADEVAEAVEWLKSGAQRIRAKLPDPEKNWAPRESFPMTSVESTCRTCNMFHACKGQRWIDGVSSNPEAKQ